MIILDASVVVELITNGPLADPLRRALSKRTDAFLVPYLLDVEVMSALRSMAASRRLDPHTSAQMIASLQALPAERYPHIPLLPRIWELRHNFTAYDATYLALAEATDSVLYTCDAKLSKGHRAEVVVFAT